MARTRKKRIIVTERILVTSKHYAIREKINDETNGLHCFLFSFFFETAEVYKEGEA